MASLNLQINNRGVITIPKSLRDSYGIKPGDNLSLLDLGGVFVLSPKESEIDAIADKIAKQLTADRLSLADMLDLLREERNRTSEKA